MGDYCSFTKAVEHLGDRWSLVIVREMLQHGPRSFSDLLDGASGISRSVLASRLRKLRDLGIVEQARAGGNGRGAAAYRLTYSGRALAPVLHELRGWSERFVPEDPAMAERDPDIVVRWLSQRVDARRVPSRPVVLDITVEGGGRPRFWLVAERGAEPSLCIADPALPQGRYVFIEADVRALLPLARGTRDWRSAIRDGSVALFGDPGLVRDLPDWFAPTSS
jgi:DNA-binding HxlR family transcriptional regulator